MDSSTDAPLPADPSARAGASRPRDASTRGRRTGTAFPVGPVAPLAYALLLGGATAAVFLAGKPEEGALGVFLVCAGVAMVACPPRVKVEWRAWLAAAAVVACAALALLPEHVLPQPAWRRTLDATPPIVMPGTISTMPTVTVFWLGLLALSLLVGLFLLAHPVRSHWLLGFALTAALVAGVYATLSIYAREAGWHYPFSGGATFGFFLNRNHTATLLFVGCLLALGVLGVVLRDGRWFVGLLAGAIMAVCATGLAFFSPSRGGVVFLVVGVLLWLAGLGQRHRDRRVVVSFITLLLACGVLFVLSSGEVRNRLLGVIPADAATAATAGGSPYDAMHNLIADARFRVYRDTFAMIRDFPLTGQGLGTFALVFPQYRQASLVDTTIIHPESDWLMFATEAGVPAAFCLLALIVLAAGPRLKAERDHAYWPLRWGCAVAAAAAALHSVVDVPVHRVQLGWWVLVVAGLALQSARASQGGRSRVQHALFVVGGLGALAMGATLIRAEWFGGPRPAPFAYGDLEHVIFQDFKREGRGAVDFAHQAMRAAPMYPTAYFELGVILNQFVGTYPEIDATFKAQRLLDPVWPLVPLEQGDSWIYDDPERSGTLWLEAFTRRLRVARAAGQSPETVTAFYVDLMRRAVPYPEAQQRLWTAVTQSPGLLCAWLEGATAGPLRERLAMLAADTEFLRRLTDAQRRCLLTAWYDKGDRAALTDFLRGRPDDWQAAVWAIQLHMLIDQRNFETAVREVATRDAIPLTLPSEKENNPTVLTAEQETADPAGAFASYWVGGNVVAAHRVLDQAANASDATAHPEVWRLRAALAAHDADWSLAWQWLDAYVRRTRPGGLP